MGARCAETSGDVPCEPCVWGRAGDMPCKPGVPGGVPCEPGVRGHTGMCGGTCRGSQVCGDVFPTFVSVRLPPGCDVVPEV